MYIIGLTGGIACGKTNISDSLRERGLPVVDADRISRALTQPGGAALPAIERAFGPGYVQDGVLDRKALGQLVFTDPDALKRLNEATHPLILRQIRAELSALSEAGAPLCALDAPLLFETGLDGLCDEIWCVWLPKKTQVERLRERDHLTRAQALSRIGSQMPAREKRRRADFVIDTRGSREESVRQAARRLEALEKSLAGREEDH